MAKTHHTNLDEVIAHFNDLEAPCSPLNRKHPLVSVVVIALLAVLAGAGGPTAIARWAKTKHEFLLRVLDLSAGVPGKDIFRRVLMLLNRFLLSLLKQYPGRDSIVMRRRAWCWDENFMLQVLTGSTP